MAFKAVKDPDATLDYGLDWSAWLEEGETITDSEWIVPGGLTLVSESFDGTTTTVWLSGGTLGQSYAVVNRVTAGARIDDRTLRLTIKER